MRAYVPALVLASFVLTACGPNYDCGAFVYSPSEERCVCPPDFMENEDFTSCIPVDAGTTPDGGMPDAPTCVPRAEECNGEDDDCDDVIDGPTASASCGSRDRATSLTCTAGECVVSACESGFLDCDLALANGCEQATGTLVACTSCGDACGWECTETGCDDAIDIDAGRDHICLVRESGSVFCWGNNDQGQLGIGSMGAAVDAPAQVVGPTGTGTLTDAIKVSAGDGFTCAVRRDRTVWCWGGNASGQLGDGTMSPATRPVAVSGLGDVRSVSAGSSHTCAVTDASEVWCWGRNDAGQSGDPGSANLLTAERVDALANVQEIHAGSRFTCALRDDGQVRCWGYQGFSGNLGDGTNMDSYLPVTPMGLPPASALAVGGGHSCIVSAAGGEMWCWGSNYSGDFGAPKFGGYRTPVRIDISGSARDVFAGWGGTCVVFTTSRSQCFLTPVTPFPEGATQIAIASSDSPSCVLRDGDVACWTGAGAAVALSPP